MAKPPVNYWHRGVFDLTVDMMANTKKKWKRSICAIVLTIEHTIRWPSHHKWFVPLNSRNSDRIGDGQTTTKPVSSWHVSCNNNLVRLEFHLCLGWWTMQRRAGHLSWDWWTIVQTPDSDCDIICMHACSMFMCMFKPLCVHTVVQLLLRNCMLAFMLCVCVYICVRECMCIVERLPWLFWNSPHQGHV